MEVRRESVVVSKGDYARVLGTLKRQGKEKSEEYKEVLESYMRHLCVITNNEERGSGNVLLLGNRLLRGAGVLQEGAAT